MAICKNKNISDAGGSAYWRNISCFNSLCPRRCGHNFKSIIFKLMIKNDSLILGEWQNRTGGKSTLIQENQGGGGGGGGHQGNTWSNVDPDLYRHMASLGHNELTYSLRPYCVARGTLSTLDQVMNGLSPVRGQAVNHTGLLSIAMGVQTNKRKWKLNHSRKYI